jgi:hypothetical protein
MHYRQYLLVPWAFLAFVPLAGLACGGSEIVRFPDAGPDGTGAGGSSAGAGGATAGSSGSAGTAGHGAAGAAGTTVGSGGTGGVSGSAGSGGTAGQGGASGTGGAAGRGGASGTGGVAGRGGASGSGGTSGASGTGGASGASGASGTGGASGTSGAGGASGSAGASGASGASGNAGRSGSAGRGGDGGDGGPDADVNTADARPDGDAAGDAGCPDIFGTYEINNADGTLCGDLDEEAPQEIRGTTQACFLHFISVVDGGAPAVNGGATLGPNGTFSGATLTLGTVARTPCRGTWDASQQELTVICGTGNDECLVELRWEGP